MILDTFLSGYRGGVFGCVILEDCGVVKNGGFTASISAVGF